MEPPRSSTRPSFANGRRTILTYKEIDDRSIPTSFNILTYNDNHNNDENYDNTEDANDDNNNNNIKTDYSNVYLDRLQSLAIDGNSSRDGIVQRKNDLDGKTALQEQIKRLKQATARMNQLLVRTKEAKQLIQEHIRSHTETKALPNPLKSTTVHKSVLNAPLLCRQPYALQIPPQSVARPRRSRSKSRSRGDDRSVRSSSADSNKSNRSSNSAYNVYRRYQAPRRPASATTKKRVYDVLKRPSTENGKYNERKSSPQRIVIQKDHLENTILKFLIDNDDKTETPILLDSLQLESIKSEISPTSYKIMTEKVLDKNQHKYGISPSLRKNFKNYKYSAQFDNQYSSWKKKLS